MHVALLLTPRTRAVREDCARYGVERVIELPGREVERDARQASKGNQVTLFASPARRWSEVTEAVRGSLQAEGVQCVALRFYDPMILLDLRSPISSSGRIGLCPTVAASPTETESLVDAYKLRRAVKNAIADLIADELRELQKQIREAHEERFGVERFGLDA